MVYNFHLYVFTVMLLIVHYTEQLMAHVREMEGYRFDLMRMYKHKPNYKMHMYGSVDVMGKLKMAEFLHLSEPL